MQEAALLSTGCLSSMEQGLVVLFRRSVADLSLARVLFDDDYYRDSYEDVAFAAFDRFAHFMDYGWREGRNPSASFSTLYYRDKHLGGEATNPLLHFVRKGQALGLATLPANDGEYLDLQEDVSRSHFSESDYRRQSHYTGDNALRFYLESGWNTLVAPSFYFEPETYLRAHKYVEKLAVCPLYHFASQQRMTGEARTPVEDILTGAPEGSLMQAIEMAGHDLAHPKLIELEPIPAPVRSVLDSIWCRPSEVGRPISVYRFQDVFVTIEGLVFTQDGKLIDVTRTHHGSAEIREAKRLVGEALEKGPQAVVERGVLAESRGATNYGHFILEMLPRAWLVRRRLNLDWPAIIHASSPEIQSVTRQALGCCGFRADEIIAVGREPVLVRELVVVDGMTSPPSYISAATLDCIDDITSNIAAEKVKKVYAPRAPSLTRDFKDEAAVGATLGQMGFERIPTMGLTFEEQVALFRGAADIVGVTGAALTNILFCRPGTRVTVFSPASASEALFWIIAERLGLVYEEIRCKETGPQLGALPWDRLIDVAPAEVERLLHR